MRLKSFSTDTMSEAMRLVREDFGDGAVIVSTQHGAGDHGGVRLTAAVDMADPDRRWSELLDRGADIDAVIAPALAYHGLPQKIARRLLDSARLHDECEHETALANAIQYQFEFQPLNEAVDGPLAFIGPCGAGKTVTTAKIAARAKLGSRQVRVITTDNFRAGGLDQLATFTKILGVRLDLANSARDLAERVKDGDEADFVLVDTAGINPFDSTQVCGLGELFSGTSVEPVLALPAGGDVTEAAEIGEIFGSLGCRRLVTTRLDATRRIGAPFAVAEAGGLGLAEATASPHVAKGLRILDGATLAGLILSRSADRIPPTKEATA